MRAKLLNWCQTWRYAGMPRASIPGRLPFSTSSAVELHTDILPSSQASNKPPIVMLHGLLGSGINFRSITTHEAISTHHAVYTMDLRNHGRSGHVDDIMTLESLAADVAYTMERRNLKDCIVLGHSLGGKVASMLALRFPQHVSHLIGVDIALSPYNTKIPAWSAVSNVVKAAAGLDPSRYTNRKEIDEALTPAIPDIGMRSFLQQNLISTKDNRYKWRINLRALEDSLHEFGSFVDPPPNGPYAPSMVKCDFIAGGKSPFLTRYHHETIKQFFPRVKFHVVEGAGHWIHAEKPKEFIATLSNILRS